MKNAVNVPSKSNEQKNIEFFVVVDFLKVTDEITGSGSESGPTSGMDHRERIHTKISWIRNTGTYIAQ